MTVPTTSNVNTYTGTGTLATYGYTYRILEDADLVVTTEVSGVTTLLVLNTDYTVTGALSYTGGTITLLAGNLALGTVLTISRVPAQTQDVSLQSQGQYDAKVVETMVDRLTMEVQALQTQVDDLEATPPEDLTTANLLLSGNGAVAQRAALATTSTTEAYGKCDKWKGKIAFGTSQSGTLTQDTAAGFGKTGMAVRWSGLTTVGSGFVLLAQYIESLFTQQVVGGYVTGSILVKHDIGVAVDFQIILSYPTAVDNFAVTANFAGSAVTSVPSGIPTSIPLNATLLPAGAANGLKVLIAVTGLTTMTNKNIWYTDMDLHPGQAALDFIPGPFALQLAQCQRYFAKTYDYSVAPGTVASGGLIRTAAYDNTSFYGGNWRFPVTMRAAPTTVMYSPGTGASAKIQDLTAAADVTGAMAFIGTNGAQGQGPGTLTATNLYQFHATADADF